MNQAELAQRLIDMAAGCKGSKTSLSLGPAEASLAEKVDKSLKLKDTGGGGSRISAEELNKVARKLPDFMAKQAEEKQKAQDAKQSGKGKGDSPQK